MASW